MRGRILAFAGRVPPAEIQLWNAGENATDYGVHIWSDRSIECVGNVYAVRGNPLLVDVEHLGAVTPEGEPPPTGGYAHLEIRAGLPWLRFEWSDYAVQQISSGQRRFLSPEYDTDSKTGEILHLYRVSLVGDPGTHHARVLATAKVRPMDPTLKAALMAAISGEDPEAALASVKALLDELGKGEAGAEGGEEVDAGAKPPEAPGADPPKEDKPPVVASAEEPVEAASEEPGKVAAAALASVAGRTPPPVPRLPAKVVMGAPVKAAAVVPPAAVDKKSSDRLDKIERDILIRDAGDKLNGPVKIWASAQSVDVVRAYLAALPGAVDAVALPNATRGGMGGGPSALRTPEARERFKNTADMPMGPIRGADGVLRIHACCPAEYRAKQANHAGFAVAANGK